MCIIRGDAIEGFKPARRIYEKQCLGVRNFAVRRLGAIRKSIIILEDVEMKALVIFFSSLMIISTCMADTTQQTEWRLDAQEARLDAIEKGIAAERAAIDQWHAGQLADLQLAAEREARQLLATERVLMTQLTTRTADAPLLITLMGSYFPKTAAIAYSRGLTTTSEYRASLNLFDAMKHRLFLDRMTGLLLNKNFRRDLSHIAGSNEVKDADSNLLRSEARRLIAVVDRLDREAQYIEKARANKLAALKAKADGLRGNVHRVMQEIRTQPAAAQIGKVAAICMVGDNSFCMIEGVDGPLQQGAKVGGNVTVVEISEHKVTFQKVGATWEQKVGQAPAVQWK